MRLAVICINTHEPGVGWRQTQKSIGRVVSRLSTYLGPQYSVMRLELLLITQTYRESPSKDPISIHAHYSNGTEETLSKQ